MAEFNVEPYFDDFSEENKFYRILFRPSVAVQARELNQLQSILQNQIKRHGDHVFKNGSVVIPGEFSINQTVDYVKLSSATLASVNITDITVLIGTTIKDTNGLQALVTHAIPATGIDPITLYLSYQNSSTTNNKVFNVSSTLSSVTGASYSLTTASSAAAGKATLAIVQKGVYYVNGFFVLCDKQTIVIDKYNATLSLSTIIGFSVSEINYTQDDIGYESLSDNAQGTYNYGAPGAHRYYIDLVLGNVDIGSNTSNFVELGRIINNSVVYLKDATDYNELDKTLARRTYDQAGNYTVKGFDIDIREHRNNDRGVYNPNNQYFAGDIITNSAGNSYVATLNIGASNAAPTVTTGIDSYGWQYTTTPNYNRGIYTADSTAFTNPVDASKGDANKLAVGFSPGKAYVHGYEIEKISTNYVNIDKPRTTAFDNNVSIPTSIGQYVQVTNVYKMTDITTCPIVVLYDGIVTNNGTFSGAQVGTCRIRGIQYDGTASAPGDTPARLYLFDIKMTGTFDFARDVKSFFNSAAGFTANVSLLYATPLTGAITTAASSTSTTIAGTGGSLFASELMVGDYITYLDSSTRYYVKVTGITSNQSITVASSPTTTPNATAYVVKTQIVEPNNKSLVFPIPHTAVSDVADHTYWIIQKVSAGSPSGNTLTISTSSGTFESDVSNYFVQDDSFLPVNVTSVVASGSTAILTFLSTPTSSWTVHATVRKTGITSRKTKTSTAGSFTYAAGGASSNSTLILDKTDCYKLISVKTSANDDITSWYTFDDGQRDSYYDFGSVTLKPSYPAPTLAVTITFMYYAHGTGDFFDVESYTSNNISYDQISYFNGTNLRDCIDFRSSINSSYVLAGMSVPKRGYNMSADISYYLPRVDKIALSSTGSLFDIPGSPSVTPKLPDDPSDGMTLCSLEMAPYTFSTGDVILNKVDNKRYTMRDIGSLEKRIDNIEYYTSLSLLEQETASLSITDSSGLDRFKNGFIVDNFSGHGIGDTTSPDYLCAIDPNNNELRPFVGMSNVNLIPNTAFSSNYKLYGDVITLPLDTTTPHVSLAQNSFASRTEFVNPFAVFAFIGDTKINPSSDDWFEVDRRPDLIQNVDGNFNSITSIAEKSGVLGTIWNAWQTQWTGTPIITNVVNNWGIHSSIGHQYINGEETATLDGRGMARTESVQIQATQIGQSRTGINTKLVSKIDTQIVGDNILSTAVIPYIRSRNVVVQVKGLKPSTTFYPFFDNIDVSAYCTPTRTITYTPLSGTFDSTSNVADISATDLSRRISGDTQVCLNIGDKITGSVSGATAIVVGSTIYTNPTTSEKTYKLYVLNTIGTFSTSDTIVGSVSGATGIFISTASTSLISSESGSLSLLFTIPNTDSLRFRTGSREFKLIDNTSATGPFTSRGRVNYHAAGILETKQSSVVATRNAELVEEAVIDNQVIIQSSTRKVSDTGWWDPLAETFLIDNPGGAFLSKVDLFFAQVDTNIPVTIEIREVVNGYPGKTVLPFSRVTIQPSQITLSSTSVIDGDGVSWPTYDTPTTFTFPSPVYVQDQTEYALVVMSDSNKYKIWISQMGDTIPGTTNTITEQPYAGVLFKSQNASTWSANQDQDMKFTIWRANFNTSVIGNVVFTNDKPQRYPLQNNPFQTDLGTAYVRVFHNNHGFSAGTTVTFDGAVAVKGISMNGTFSVQANPQIDSYLVLTSTNATGSGYGGGSNCYATTNIKYETLYPNINALSFPDTTTTYSMLTTNWSSGISTTNSCTINDNNYFNVPQVVGNTANSLRINSTLKSTNPSISPVIDTHRLSAIAVTNKIDWPDATTYNFASIDELTLFTGTATLILNANTISSSTTATVLKLKQIIPGTYIRFTGSTTNSVYNNVSLLVTAVDSSNGALTVSGATFNTETPTSLSLYYSNNFVDEITPVGSSTQSKYVSKEVNLAIQSTTLRIKLAARIPTEAEVDVYYKIGTGATVFKTTNWTYLASDNAIPKAAIGSETFTDIDFTASNLPLFTKVSIKIVMKSTNTAAVPRIKDLRIIACA